jgi:hypothetical protein
MRPATATSKHDGVNNGNHSRMGTIDDNFMNTAGMGIPFYIDDDKPINNRDYSTYNSRKRSILHGTPSLDVTDNDQN